MSKKADPPVEFVPRCPYCGADPFTPAIRESFLGDDISGGEQWAFMFCAEEKCRKLITAGIKRIVKPRPGMSPAGLVIPQ